MCIRDRFWPVLLKIYRCFCGQLAEYTVIWVYWKKWIKFHIHFSAVFPDCLGEKGSIRRLAPTTELESRVCWLGLLALEIEINTSGAFCVAYAKIWAISLIIHEKDAKIFDFFAFFCLARIDTRTKLLAITCWPIPLKISRLEKSIFMVIWQKTRNESGAW